MKTHTIIPLVLSITIITSCRTHKESAVTCSAVSSAVATESVASRHERMSHLRLNDSCRLSVDSPQIEILRPDSTVVRLTARRLTVASRADLRLDQSDTLIARRVAQSQADSVTHTVTRTDSRVEVASLPWWMWPAVVSVALLLLLLVGKYIHRLTQKNLVKQ